MPRSNLQILFIIHLLLSFPSLADPLFFLGLFLQDIHLDSDHFHPELHMMNKRSGFGGRSTRDEDFEEEDVWGYVKESKDSSPMTRKSKEYSSTSSSSSSPWRIHSAPRTIPRVNNNTQTTIEAKTHVQQSSAPVDIPDWSKIYDDHGGVVYENGHGDNYNDDDADDDDDGDGMVPPHEWIARKLARSQISSFSVCEGIGRTLKGRDLSKMRNAILTKTGFLE